MSLKQHWLQESGLKVSRPEVTASEMHCFWGSTRKLKGKGASIDVIIKRKKEINGESRSTERMNIISLFSHQWYYSLNKLIFMITIGEGCS